MTRPDKAFLIQKVLPFLLLATGLYLLYFPQIPIGFFNDDAKYIGLAQSLWQGRYVDQAIYTAPAETLFPPGYPFFLAPFVKLVQPHWAWLKLTSVALTLLSICFLWDLTRGCASRWIRYCVVGLFAFNPILAKSSGAIMSERLFICLELGVFWAFWKAMEGRERTWGWVLAVFLSWMMLTRSTAISLLAAITLSVVWLKQRRLGVCLSGPFLIWGLWLFRNHQVSQDVSGYLNFVQAQLPYFLAHPAALLDNAIRVAYLAFVYTFAGFSFPRTGLGMVLCLAWTALVLFWAARGLQQITAPKPWRLGVALFIVFFFGVQALWTALDVRYVMPLLPFLLLTVLNGIRSRKMAIALAVLLTGSYAYRHYVFLNPKVTEVKVPRSTFTWMQQNIPAGSHVLYPSLNTLWLYTGFQGIAGLGAGSREEFHAQLVQRGVTYALFRPSQSLSVHGAGGIYNQQNVFEANRTWMYDWPERFKLVYTNKEESTIVFAVQKRPTHH